MNNGKLFSIKNFQAESRIHILEEAVSEAQSSESQVTDLQQWIFRVDDLLNDFIEHDTTFECLPHDFQVINVFVGLYFFNYVFTNTPNKCFCYHKSHIFIQLILIKNHFFDNSQTHTHF